MEQIIISLIKFDGNRNHDVVNWLQYIEEVLDRVQLQASHKYVAVSYFLTGDTAIWFKHKQSNIPNRFTFKPEFIEGFSSSYLSRLLDQHHFTGKEALRTLEQELDILHVPASNSTIPRKGLENDNTSFDLINVNQINSFED